MCVGATAGLVAIADESVKGFNIARAIARIPLSEGSHPVFIAAYLRTDWVQRHIQNELRTVAQPTLNIKQICELPDSSSPARTAARIRPSRRRGGEAEDGAARVVGGPGRALRHPPVPRLSRRTVNERPTQRRMAICMARDLAAI